MLNCVIQSISAVDARFALPAGAGTDSVHNTSQYCMAITRLVTDKQICGSGIALTLGDGNAMQLTSWQGRLLVERLMR